MRQHLKAIIFVPDDGERATWEKMCLDHCDRHGHRVVSLIVGGVERWPDVLDMIRAQEADVIVVARPEHLPADRVPRTEVASG